MTQTVLIVDDEPMARDILEGFLFNEGYNLIFAGSGPETISILEEAPPDVILLDVIMPRMNGFEVCQQVKATEKWRHIPIILVTALSSKANLARGLEAGADDFLHKPVNKLELQARVRSMLRIKKQYDDLQATMLLREDLARMLVHDIRNPLAVIMAHSGHLVTKRSSSVEVLLEGFSKINAQTLRLDRYLNDMLLLAKMESGQLILNCAMHDMNSLVEEVMAGYKVLAEARKVNLITNLPHSSRHVRLDINLCQRVLDNLISNALKFSPPDTTVIVQTDYPNNGSNTQFRLRVIDEGPGIPEEHRERVFNKFEIIALKRKSVPQVGLGLAFCKMVVEAHGGYIGVKPNNPTGTIFEVEM